MRSFSSSNTIFALCVFFLVCFAHISTTSTIPIQKNDLNDSEINQTDGEVNKNPGIVPGTVVLVGGVLGQNNGFAGEVGKAMAKSMKDSAGGTDGGGAASTVVNLPNTGYTVLKAADKDRGLIGTSTHALFGGKVKTSSEDDTTVA